MSGGLAGEVVVFTGTLRSFPRRRAEAAVTAHGGQVASSVTRKTTLVVVGQKGWPVLPDGSISRKVRRAESLQVLIVSESVFLERAGFTTPATRNGTFSTSAICRMLNLTERQLQRWAMFGLISETEGEYDYQDLVSARNLAALLDSGASVESVARSLSQLARWIPDVERPLAQLKLVIKRGGLEVKTDGVSMAPTGQILLPLEFDTEPLDSQAMLEEAMTADAAENDVAAARLYQAYIDLEPDNALALFNLGTLLGRLGNYREAEKFLRKALAIDPENSEGWYNLADVLDSLGKQAGAVSSLKKCLLIAPAYKDAHFNLAALYQKAGKHSEARSKWRSYLDLDPTGDWAEVARAHLRLSELR